MSVVWEKIKSFRDWFSFAFSIITSLGVGKMAKAFLISLTQIPSAWVEAIWWFVAAGVFALLIFITKKRKLRVGKQNMSSKEQLAINFDPDDFFKRTYKGIVSPDIEKILNGILKAKYQQPHEREEFLVKFIATVLPVANYELIWSQIYRSQVLFLQELNRKQPTLDQAKEFYEAAKARYPETYNSYSFDQWLGWIRNQNLVIQSGMEIFITIPGKDFLMYLVNVGRHSEDKLF